MSQKLIDLAWQQDVKTTAKTILVYMAWLAGDDARCWPTVTQLAKAARVTVAAVFTALNTLEAAGLIQRDHRKAQSNIYTLTLEARE